MNGYLDKLNLRPHEKRILVAAFGVVFIVVNIFWVWPRFDDWDKVKAALAKSRKTLETYEAEIARIPQYEARLRELEGQGSSVLPEEQALQLMRIVQSQAQVSGVPITGTRVVTPGAGTSTNAFFDEQAVSINVSTREEELVNFLHALGSGSSLIRVRDLDLRPDPPRYRLNGSITLVASYQKRPKAPPKPVTAAPVSSAPNPPAVAASRPSSTNSLQRKP